MPSLMPRATYRLEARGRAVVGREALQVQGFPIQSSDLSSASEVTMHDLAGNMFSGTVVLAVLVGVLARLPSMAMPTEAEESSTLEDVNGILASLCD